MSAYADQRADQERPTAQDPTNGLQEQPDEPQEAHAARRELIEHAPEFTLGGKAERHHHGPAGPRHASGEIPRAELDGLAAVFAESDTFGPALERLSHERAVILTGAHSTGRRGAALMLPHTVHLDLELPSDDDAFAVGLRVGRAVQLRMRAQHPEDARLVAKQSPRLAMQVADDILNQRLPGAGQQPPAPPAPPAAPAPDGGYIEQQSNPEDSPQ
ncbi:hypothetical protein ACFWZ2_28455 [Streptomyces sp. NPDC059002]|uniref:hypothetical protein n=1 Tax=Streptomyces sp. NPDC059002 TaxID=3346690 RepID=UPI0036B54AFD